MCRYRTLQHTRRYCPTLYQRTITYRSKTLASGIYTYFPILSVHLVGVWPDGLSRAFLYGTLKASNLQGNLELGRVLAIAPVEFSFPLPRLSISLRDIPTNVMILITYTYLQQNLRKNASRIYVLEKHPSPLGKREGISAAIIYAENFEKGEE